MNILSVFAPDGEFIIQTYTKEDSVSEDMLNSYREHYGAESTLEITTIEQPYEKKIDKPEDEEQ